MASQTGTFGDLGHDKALCKSTVGSRPSDHYFRSVCWFVCLFVCAEFFSAVFDPISIKLGHVICLGLVVSARI